MVEKDPVETDMVEAKEEEAIETYN